VRLLFRNIILISVLLLTWACQSNFEGSIIDVELVHADGSLLLMEDIATPEKIIIDSAIVTDGKVKFRLYTNEGIYRLRQADANAMIFLYIDGKSGRQFVSWDLTQPEAYTVKGSKDSEDLQHIVSVAAKSAKEYALLDSVLKVAGADEALTLQAMELNRSNLQKFIAKIADSLPKADVAAFALNYADLSPSNLSYLLSVTERLHAKDPRARYARMWYDTFGAYRKAILDQVESGLPVGTKAPDFSLPHRLGDTLRLSDFKGRYVLLDFWASWCQPCRNEHPGLVEAYRSYRKRNFTIVSVSLDSKREQWDKGISVDGLVWKHHASDLLKWKSSVVTLYNLKSIPANYLLDTNGVILARDLKGEVLLAFLDAHLPKEKASSNLVKDTLGSAQTHTQVPVADPVTVSSPPAIQPVAPAPAKQPASTSPAPLVRPVQPATTAPASSSKPVQAPVLVPSKSDPEPETKPLNPF
jgi:peroxiredoxin